MTDEQKQSILYMRAEGMTFVNIAAQLDLPVSTVKAYYRKTSTEANQKTSTEANPSVKNPRLVKRNPSSLLVEASHATSACRQCGADLHLHNGNQMKRFCSERCRQKWWRAHPGLVTKSASTSVCVTCGKTFKNGGNPARRYCSRTCYYLDRYGDVRCEVNKHTAALTDTASSDTASTAPALTDTASSASALTDTALTASAICGVR